MSDRYLVISSDGHAGPRPEVYRDYLDPEYRDEFDRQNAARMKALDELARERTGEVDAGDPGAEIGVKRLEVHPSRFAQLPGRLRRTRRR